MRFEMQIVTGFINYVENFGPFQIVKGNPSMTWGRKWGDDSKKSAGRPVMVRAVLQAQIKTQIMAIAV